MGVRMSKISYKMSEVEQKLGYVQDGEHVDVGTQPQIVNDLSAPEDKENTGLRSSDKDTSTESILKQSIVPRSLALRRPSTSQYHSNSSLSSGNGDVSCVHLSWPKCTAEKIARRRKGKSLQLKDDLQLEKIATKKPKKNYLKAIAGSSKKKADNSQATDSDCSLALSNGAAAPSTSCVCTAYRRTNSEPQEPRFVVPVSGCSIAVVLEPMSLEHRLSSPHVLGVFNPEDYPIEDEDEKMRRQRAKEMSEGVELSEKFGMLNFKSSCQPAAHSQIDYIHVLVPDLKEITACSFYWGKIDRYAAEKLLEDKPEGTFLLRDSAQEEYLFSVSFRRYGRSLHARIEQWGHAFSFDAHDPSVYSAPTVTGLIEHYKDPSYCMFFEPMLTVRLHRNFTFSLQHLARSVICNSNTYDSISALPLPKTLKDYCREYHYKQRVRIRNLPD